MQYLSIYTIHMQTQGFIQDCSLGGGNVIAVIACQYGVRKHA